MAAVTFKHQRVAVITGACGGMGTACARLLGRRYRLVLADVNQDGLAEFANRLMLDGYDVAGRAAGDLADEGVLAELTAATGAAGVLGALAHTAGLSGARSGWEEIVRTNLVATHRVLDAFEPLLTPGAAAVVIASIAGHRGADPEVDVVTDAPNAPDLLQRLNVLMRARADAEDELAFATYAYGVTKRAVIRMTEARAPAWAAKGARIVSISPGIIFTPMGRAEADNNPPAAAVADATPIGRWGTAQDIASAVEFLVSDLASFITGADLRIDGGVIPAMRGVTF
jgi:NAD(P)-dependent dehydrogenase (short-subunit alcohol dehydrogenase family)